MQGDADKMSEAELAMWDDLTDQKEPAASAEKQRELNLDVIPLLAIVVPIVLLVTPMRPATAQDAIRLPAPTTRGTVSLEEALRARRSVRGFTDDAMTLAQLGQLLWAAQGVPDARSHP